MGILDREITKLEDGTIVRTMTDEELSARTNDQMGQCRIIDVDKTDYGKALELLAENMSIKKRSEPIIEFTDEAQAYECLKYWKRLLFLDDWLIMIDFADNPTLNGKRVGAVVEQFPIEQCACITFRKPYVADKDCVLIDKPCHEKDMVHELEHLRIQQMDKLNSIEEVMHDLYLHRLIDQSAKSLIMAKYGLTIDYFKNF